MTAASPPPHCWDVSPSGITHKPLLPAAAVLGSGLKTLFRENIAAVQVPNRGAADPNILKKIRNHLATMLADSEMVCTQYVYFASYRKHTIYA